MAKLRLQALAPGKRFVGRDKDGSKRFVNFTPEYCRQQFEANSALVASGIPVPASWEHRDDARPGRLSRDDMASARAKGTLGFVEKYEIDDKSRVFAIVDAPNEVDAKKAETVRFCSPEIDQFTDGTGKEWGEVFTHIAITPRPVQHDQQPITRLSLTYAGPIRLSVDPEKGEDMAEENETETETEGDGSESAGIKDLVAALEECGFNIPEEASTLKEIIIAVKAHCGGEGDDDGDGDGDESEVVERQTAPVQMSLQKANERAEKTLRKDMERQIDGLLRTGRISPLIAKGLKDRLGKLRLSFDKNGDVKESTVSTEINAYAKLPANSVWSKRGRKTRLSAADVERIDPPEDVSGQKSDAEVLAAWDKT